jgi:uncharacterized protein
VILVDTGPLVALFDPRDDAHVRARQVLQTLRRPLATTVPVLTEAFHLLGPASRGSEALSEFVDRKGMSVWFFSSSSLERAFELMRKYRDRPMDLADASLVVAAELLRSTEVFTIDRDDFTTYRARIGKTSKVFTLVG